MDLEERLHKYLNTSNENHLTEKSEIWSSLLSQRNAPSSFDDLADCLSYASRQTSGTGDSERYSEIKTTVLNYISDILDSRYLEEIEPSRVGRPDFISMGKHKTYFAHLWNLVRFQHYHQILERNGYLTNKLSILEIGPGYGGAAYNFIKLGNVNSYTLVDIKENLINSVYFLSQNFPDWEVNFIDRNNPPKLSQKCLNFVTADRFAQLDLAAKFDLSLNTDSFGEMPEKVAKTYLSELPKLVRDDGVMISMNGHRRGQYELKGILKVSEYGYPNYQNLRFSYKNGFSSSMDDFGHFSLCLNSPEPTDFSKFYNVMGDLFAAGLNVDLDEIIENFNSKKLTEGDLNRLNLWDEMLENDDFETNDDLVNRYFKFVRTAIKYNKTSTSEYNFLRTHLKSSQALYFCKLCKLITSKDWSIFEEIETNNAARFLNSDVVRFKDANIFKRYAFLEVRKMHLHKKFFPRRKFKAPLVLRLRRTVEKIQTSIKAPF